MAGNKPDPAKEAGVGIGNGNGNEDKPADMGRDGRVVDMAYYK